MQADAVAEAKLKEQERDKALAAERQGRQELFNAKLAEAKSGRRSGEPGQRYATWKALTEAAGLAHDLGLGPEVLQKLRSEAIACLAPEGAGDLDPWTDPETLGRAVTEGVLDAPQLKNNPFARGALATRMVGGACKAVDAGPASTGRGAPIGEEQRLAHLLNQRRKV